MMYSSPTVPNRIKLELRCSRFSPFGPTTTPARIIPMMPGTRSFRSSSGTRRMISRISENTRTGPWKGSSNETFSSMGGGVTPIRTKIANTKCRLAAKVLREWYTDLL